MTGNLTVTYSSPYRKSTVFIGWPIVTLIGHTLGSRHAGVGTVAVADWLLFLVNTLIAINKET